MLDPANNEPSGITNDPSGGTDLWIVDHSDATVYRYDESTERRTDAAFATDTFVLMGDVMTNTSLEFKASLKTEIRVLTLGALEWPIIEIEGNQVKWLGRG